MNFQPLRDFLDQYLPMLGVPGSDTVIYKDHKEIFRHTSGYDDIVNKTPLRKDAIYNIYSCTKVATGVAALQLIEKGEILLSDPVYAYIPEFRELTVEIKDESGNVTETKTLVTEKIYPYEGNLAEGKDFPPTADDFYIDDSAD